MNKTSSEETKKVVNRFLRAIIASIPMEDVFGQLVSLKEECDRPRLTPKQFKESIPLAQNLYGQETEVKKLKRLLLEELKKRMEEEEILPSVELTYKYMAAYAYLGGNINKIKRSVNPTIV